MPDLKSKASLKQTQGRVGFVAYCVFLGLTLSMLFQGCSQSPPKPNLLKLTKNGAYQLLAPASFGRALSMTQQITIRYDGQTRKLLSRLELDEKTMLVVIMSPLGNRALTLVWDGEKPQIQTHALASMPFDPRMMLADMQLALWPKAPVIIGLTQIETPKKRIWLDHGQPVIEIRFSGQFEKAGSRILIKHLERGYSLDILTLEQQSP